MKAWLALSLLLGCVTCAGAADTIVETYSARLSVQDHFSSSGVRLTTAAAIIRQDRANFHKFSRGDAEDEGDAYFADARNRETLEKMLERGRSTRAVINAIVNGTPLVVVTVWRSGGGRDFVTVVLRD